MRGNETTALPTCAAATAPPKKSRAHSAVGVRSPDVNFMAYFQVLRAPERLLSLVKRVGKLGAKVRDFTWVHRPQFAPRAPAMHPLRQDRPDFVAKIGNDWAGNASPPLIGN